MTEQELPAVGVRSRPRSGAKGRRAEQEAQSASAAPRVGRGEPGATRRVLELGLFVEVPLLVVGWLGWLETRGHGLRDFMVFRTAGHAVLHGHSPYVQPTAALLADNDRFVYPTPFAFPFVPFALLPHTIANVGFYVLSVAAVIAAARLLGVTDIRCYGVAAVTIPVLSGFTLGEIGPFLLLLTAVGWRYRDRPVAGVPLAVAAAAKLFLWPLLLWLLVTKRLRATAVAAGTLVCVTAIWALVDLQGLRRYPETVKVLNEVQRWKSYSPQSLAISLGASPRVADVVVVLVVAAGVFLTAVLARRADGDRAALAAAIFTALLGTPILWLHYLIFVLVPIALVRPRLSWLWAAPAVLAATPHPESAGALWRILVVLGATSALAALTLTGFPAPRRREA